MKEKKHSEPRILDPSEVKSNVRLVEIVDPTPVPVVTIPLVDQPQGPGVRVVTAEEMEEMRRLPRQSF